MKLSNDCKGRQILSTDRNGSHRHDTETEIFIGNRKVNLNNGLYEMTYCGDFNLDGYISMTNGRGDVVGNRLHRSIRS